LGFISIFLSILIILYKYGATKMCLRYLFLIYILFITSLHAEFNTTSLDEYRFNISCWLVDSSNDIDDYFFESNNSTQTSHTYAEVRSSFALEDTQNSEYAVRLRLRLNLPKIQKQLRIVFEDASNDDALYDGTQLNSQYQLEEKQYFLRLEYFNYMIKQLNLAFSSGVRFTKTMLHPYLNIKAKYNVKNEENEKKILSNRFRYYINGDIEDVVSFNTLYTLNQTLYFTIRNSFRYRNWEDFQKIVNDASFIKTLKVGEQASAGFTLVTELKNNRNLTLNYPQLYVTYRNQLYKNWIYYEIHPSLLWRKENDYESSARLMLTLGMIFKKE